MMNDYVIFWKPYSKRIREFLYVLEQTGCFYEHLLKIYWPFDEINYN